MLKWGTKEMNRHDSNRNTYCIWNFFFFTVLFPLLLLVLLAIRRAISLRPLFIGVLAFFVSQILLRIPLLSILSTQGWFLTFAQQQMLLYLILLSASAGLFEESARLLGAKCFCKGRRSYRDAVSFGLGHGLCEVVCWWALAPSATSSTV